MLGRLEDLSVADIIQIVFLSRRTGVLEISESHGRSTVLFVNGHIVNASSPTDTDLASELRGRYPSLRHAGEVPVGVAVIEQNVLSLPELAGVIIERIRRILIPMLTSREGHFTFIMADSIVVTDIEYDPLIVFGQEGLEPSTVLGDGAEKLKPLRGLAETVTAARSLRRPTSEAPMPATTGVLPAPISEPPFAAADAAREESLEDFLARVLDTEEEAEQRGSGSLEDPRETSSGARTVLVLEPDPLMRVSVRRVFARNGIAPLQFSAPEQAMRAISEHLGRSQFFVTIVDAEAGADAALGVLRLVKRANRRLPVLVLHQHIESSLRRVFSDAGADVFARKPAVDASGTSVQSDLDLFCGELFDLTAKAYGTWEQMSSSFGEGDPTGVQFYEMSEREKTGRGIGLLKQFINEVTEPEDPTQIVETILRLASEYFDRAILFSVESDRFLSLGSTDNPNLRITTPRSATSVLREVLDSGKPQRGDLVHDGLSATLQHWIGREGEAAVLPVLNENEVVGVLFGDNASTRIPIGNITGLEIFLAQAGFTLRTALSARPTS